MGISTGDGFFETYDSNIEYIQGFSVCANGCLSIRGTDLDLDGRCDVVLMQSDGNHAYFRSIKEHSLENISSSEVQALKHVLYIGQKEGTRMASCISGNVEKMNFYTHVYVCI